MIFRLLILLALVLGTVPAPAAAAPACHDMVETAMPMEHEAPAPQPDKAPAMGKTLCVGCIAPSTMRATAVATPLPLIARHDASGPARVMTGALLTPEPPPPSG
ncbi:hypothetical protein J2Y54_002722 [Sphingomonas sp. BE123]|uniref:hypothetical protein n=1 Tax=Sphingomonas sp. BE123 TaxID=2817842 RepID=UPI00285E5C4E|nr:hypothetical protein [Sphingomonas sp. BE123]MDR6853202.1 hypothetical protein [Sphingomonas sp. BE123]